MKKEDLIHLRNQLNKVADIISISNFCKEINCDDCIFNNKCCNSQCIDEKIKELLNMIQEAMDNIKEIKKCDKCGHELKGDEK